LLTASLTVQRLSLLETLVAEHLLSSELSTSFQLVVSVLGSGSGGSAVEHDGLLLEILLLLRELLVL